VHPFVLTLTFLHFLAAIDLDFFLSDSRGTVYLEIWLRKQNVYQCCTKTKHTCHFFSKFFHNYTFTLKMEITRQGEYFSKKITVIFLKRYCRLIDNLSKNWFPKEWWCTIQQHEIMQLPLFFDFITKKRKICKSNYNSNKS
jgi:hypothetical protein